ncbi:Hypothetical protein TART1_2782 [Trichococcus shcherbakoviae]|uniref:Uncharacterized protein n=1 Tax=Trichococcus shcherbakoviae TaxID=2094020 RepID=A0A383TIW3_9LACT|nr:Hypothetical protein TART1_2782 [Trichococcus shcherbakoviae]
MWGGSCFRISGLAVRYCVSPKYKKTAHLVVRITNSRIPCDFFASIRLFLYLLPHVSWIFFDQGMYCSSTSLL